MGLSVIVITYNEENNILDCLRSVAWSDEIIVVDSFSTDKTFSLAKSFTQNVFQKPWSGYASAKQFALSKASNEWVLWIDADERVTPELAEEIRNTINNNSIQYSGYEIARKAYFLGKWIKHCGWYPGYVIRLFRKQAAQFTNVRVHESIEIDGKVGRLKSDLLHFTDESLEHYFKKFNDYTTLAALDLVEMGTKSSILDLTFRPLFTFLKMFILRRGFLDGMHGFILSVLSSAYVFSKYAKVWEFSTKKH